MLDRVPQLELPEPHPDLSPQDVIKIQLDALQFNDLLENDSGIRLAFDYASPDNRRVIGPLKRFIHLVKEQVYSPMLSFNHAELDRLLIDHGYARQRVHVVQQDATQAYLFILSLQTSGRYTGCWMTESLLPQN